MIRGKLFFLMVIINFKIKLLAEEEVVVEGEDNMG
jgi:hypothetical protein